MPSESVNANCGFLKNDFAYTKHVQVNVLFCDEMNQIVKEGYLKQNLVPDRECSIILSEWKCLKLRDTARHKVKKIL